MPVARPASAAPLGVVYTPPEVARAMVELAFAHLSPDESSLPKYSQRHFPAPDELSPPKYSQRHFPRERPRTGDASDARAPDELSPPKYSQRHFPRERPGTGDANDACELGPAPDELSSPKYSQRHFSRERERQFPRERATACDVEAVLALRICDPAVGEGVFLVEVVDYLARRTGLDRRTICERCIVGVDVDARAIEVARRALPGADLRVGNALAMAWDETFDLVIGNPPYVRQEHQGDKVALRGFESYDGVADLYVYFLELAHRIGRHWCFITPNKWMTAAYGAPLRAFLAKRESVAGIVDLSGQRIFDADAYASVVWGTSAGATAVIAARGDLATPRVPHDRARWTREPWHIDDADDRALIDLLHARWPAFETCAGTPMRGVVTGANDVFVLDDATALRLGESPFVRRLVRGRDLQRFAACPEKWILRIDHGVALDELPARIVDYLRPHRARLEPGQGRKPGAYRWWQLQDPIGPLNASAAPKLLYQDIMTQPMCALDVSGLVADTTVWMLPTRDRWLLAVLGSSLFGWYARRRFPPALNGAVRPKRAYIARFPIAPAPPRFELGDEAAVLDAYGLDASQRRVVERATGDRGRTAARRSRAR